MDFTELKGDKPVQEKLVKFHNSVNKIEEMIQKLQRADIYEQLTLKEKVDYDLFVSYTLNTLFWLYLRVKNEDPNNNDVKNQLNRIKEYMLKAKQAHERQTIRPKVDKAVAGRFIKHGIQSTTDGQPVNKKIKFAD
ncbi:unnamed protein product [Phyllotreta striolata]|uniref:Nuclear nucleic acid-binding protein C1D n=1 Tax=Phyllotreta striolata TaxID=444603 RepID=A0A9N9THM9_PHYSR|nr:unnamed protein product [Phyllotreta striolata]